MIKLEVYVEDYDHAPFKSKVYCIDTGSHKFLVVNEYGSFLWVETRYCTLINEKENDND